MARAAFRTPASPPQPADSAGNLLTLLENKANGRLLVHDLADYLRRDADRHSRACPRGWLTAFSGGDRTLGHPAITPAQHQATSLVAGSGSATSNTDSSDSSAVVTPPDLSAYAHVPVPTLYVGLLAAPIAPGRPTLNAEGLVSSLQHGVLPSDTLPKGDREVWRAASRVTDSLSAYNICQAKQLAGRKLILTERSVAEQLARGSIQLVPVQGGIAGREHRGGGLGWLNPLAPLLKLGRQIAEGQRLSKQVQRRAATLGGQPVGEGATANQQQQGYNQQPPVNGDGGGAPLRASSSADLAQPQPQPAPQPQPQYSLQDMPSGRLLPPTSPPQLAWVPLRVALQLLRLLPQHFVMLQRCWPQQQPETMQQAISGKRRQDTGYSAPRQDDTFTTAASPGGLVVHVIPGLNVRQVAPDGSAVEFTPAFLCAEQVQALWQDLREISGGAMLVYRRLERALMRRRLEAAAAMIAGGSIRGSQASSSAQDDDEIGGMDEPPEVADFVRELGGSLSHEAAPTAAMGGTSGNGVQAPSGLPRLAAMFACGVVSLAAQGLNWAGNTADWLMMATPIGPRLLGVPEASIKQCRLSDILTKMREYNQEQAVLSAHVAAVVEHLQQQHQRGASVAGGHASRGGSGSNDKSGSQSAEAFVPSATAQEPQHLSAAIRRQREEQAAVEYSRTLAAAAIWLALGCKSMAEDSGLAGVPLTRLLARALMQQQGQAAMLGSGSLHELQGAQAGAPPSAVAMPKGMQDAIQQVLAEGLPNLEHNGFHALFVRNSSSTSARSGGSASGKVRGTGGGKDGETAAAGVAAGEAAVATAISKYCTGDTQVGLSAFVREDVHGGGFSAAMGAVGTPPSGRGLILIGDMGLKPRQRGRTASRTTARWLTVAADDGRKLL